MRLTATRIVLTMLGLALSVMALSLLGSAQISSAQILSTGNAASVQQIQALIEEYKKAVRQPRSQSRAQNLVSRPGGHLYPPARNGAWT